jgi:poly(A) polymerase/tRNA nucleotidyltransferase (CCA-adding enzyme)
MTRIALPHDPGLARILAVLPEARLVGGVVRDLIAGHAVADIDLATPDLPDTVTRKLEQAGLRVIPTGLGHGTVTALAGGQPYEITTLRRDVATDGRHAEVAFTDNWRQDAARRDFTINALSANAEGAVFDYFGGVADLHAGRVRFVGDPATRIAEDFLRILRFFRFFARYARGEADAAALQAISAAVPGLAQLSPERVWSELKRILQAPGPAAAIRLMASAGVLAAVLPEGSAPEALAALIARGAPADPLLRFAALAAGDSVTLAKRLHMANDERDRLAALRIADSLIPDSSDAALRRHLADTPADIAIARTWLRGGAGPAWAALRDRLAATPRPVFPLGGQDALALGASPGPALGQALRATRAWWLEGGCVASAEECRLRLASFLLP